MSESKAPTYRLPAVAWPAFTEALPEGTDAVALRGALTAAVKAVQRVAEDALVRESRRRNWCGEFEGAAARIFPNGPIDGWNWTDTDGKTCRGEQRISPDGLTVDGRDQYGRDAEGCDANGIDENGWHRGGLDANGLKWDDPARYVYDGSGIDRDGFMVDGTVNRYLTRQSLAERREMPETNFRFDGMPRGGGYTLEQRQAVGYQGLRPVTDYRQHPWPESYRRAAGGQPAWLGYVDDPSEYEEEEEETCDVCGATLDDGACENACSDCELHDCECDDGDDD